MADSEIQLLMVTLSGTDTSSDGEVLRRCVPYKSNCHLNQPTDRLCVDVTRRQTQRDFDRDFSR